LLCLLTLSVAGCSSSNLSAPSQPNDNRSDKDRVVSNEPVTITFYNAGANPESYYKQYIETHIQKYLPHITINYIQQGEGTTISDLLAAGTIPDIMYVVSPRIAEMNELGVLDDLSPLAARHQIDLSKLADGLEPTFRAYGNGKLLFMPWGLSNYALYYNKDIFDRLGVVYPKDGMTWDEVYQLARTMTRTVDGVQYRGFDFTPTYYMNYNQLSLPFVDQTTEKAAVQTNGWKHLFETFGRFYSIPGNEADKSRSPADFLGNKTLAMTAGTTLFPQILEKYSKGDKINFDIVSFPTFSELPKTGLQTVAAGFAITPQSKHKDQAMQIIKLMLSEEVQKEGAEVFRLPVIKGEQFRQSLGKYYPELANIRVSSLIYNTNAPTKVVTLYDDLARSVLNTKFNEFKGGTKDVNTILREAEDEINAKIVENKAAKGSGVQR
jgi:multiple sugar transport system substrate-binding protein